MYSAIVIYIIQCSMRIDKAQRGRKSNKICSYINKVTVFSKTGNLRIKGNAINYTCTTDLNWRVTL